MQHPLGVCGVLKRGNECASRGECCSPSSPTGLLPHCVTARARLRGGVNFAAHLSHGCSFSPSEYTFGGDPLERTILLTFGIYFSSFLIKFESRIEIIKRRTILTKRRSLCPTENTFGGDPDGERKAARRAQRPCLLNVSFGLRGRTSLPHRKYFRRGPRIAATCKRRLAACERLGERRVVPSPKERRRAQIRSIKRLLR